jgi:uracil-DNA glycosylase
MDQWFQGLDLIIDFDNVSHYPTPGNRPLRISEIREAVPGLKQRITRYNKVIAVGKTAAKALEIAGIEHFAAPHPSGLNRFWNDAKQAAAMIESIRDYVGSER